jgi:hypothetical protein
MAPDRAQELLDGIDKIPAHSHEFARSLIAQLRERGSLSEKQWWHFDRLHKAATVSDTPQRFSRIAGMFSNAEKDAHGDGEGLKCPRLHLVTENGFAFRIHKSQSGKHAGTYQVKEHRKGDMYNAHWFGRIDANGDWQPNSFSNHTETDSVLATLKAVDSDPLTAVKVQGQRTGNCCMCGRELTNALSRQLGIGPICRTRWGL